MLMLRKNYYSDTLALLRSYRQVFSTRGPPGLGADGQAADCMS